jgi:dTDP-4-amino-4,6-dideoxygalactose transaminase
VTNGTISLQIMLQTLPKKGQILTTPFTYIATASAICWQGFEPVFVDIDPGTLNVDPAKVAEKISDKTVGMLFTHCFGVPCDVDRLEALSKEYKLPLFYDAAHAFGVYFKGKSLLNYGKMSSLSFHSTKLFHTVEGGAIICSEHEDSAIVQHKRNFGHNGPEVFNTVGINGKNSEFHAAMGLCNLKYIDDILLKRKAQYELYLSLLAKNNNLRFQTIPIDTKYNYAYFPVIFQNEAFTLHVQSLLEKNSISPRRYFYPSLNKLEIFNEYFSACPEAEKIASSILCLPLYHELDDKDIERICSLINDIE